MRCFFRECDGTGNGIPFFEFAWAYFFAFVESRTALSSPRPRSLQAPIPLTPHDSPDELYDELLHERSLLEEHKM